MGGPGSGWQKRRKTTVAECCTLRLEWLRKALDAGPGWGGPLEWTASRSGKVTAAIQYVVIGTRDEPAIRLHYSWRRGDEEWHQVRDVVQLTFSTLCYGGRCPYMVCPGCWARVRTLHLPPGGTLFRCRACHDLTYGSCQDSHKYDGLFRGMAAELGMGVGQVARAMRRRYPHA